MSLVYPPSISVPFGRDAVDPYIRVVPVLPPVEPGAASWETGFPPANMTIPTSGGIPPFGKDMNGIINYISANILWAAAGCSFVFNADIVTNSTGYPIGAILVSAVDKTVYFYNTLVDNTNDPDSVTTGWIQFSPLSTPTGKTTLAPAASTFDNVAVGKSTGALDVDTTAGNVTYTGITAGSDGQILTVTNTGANLLTLAALNTGSLLANRFRLVADLAIPQNDSLTLRYIIAVGMWIKL